MKRNNDFRMSLPQDDELNNNSSSGDKISIHYVIYLVFNSELFFNFSRVQQSLQVDI